jgi:iron complex transport system substrate-binding protein
MAPVPSRVIPESACVAVRKRGTAPFWLNAIIKKGPYPFFGIRQARRLPGLAAAVVEVAMLIGAANALPYAQDAMPRRIVSLVPATTEMLFAMGAGSRIAGVSNYDRFPPEVARLPKVGGLLDPDVETLLSLKPDLVIVYDTQADLKRQLERAQVPMYQYLHRGLPDIMETMRALGVRIGAKTAADAAATSIEQQLAAVGRRVAGRPRPSTLLVFGREPGTMRRVHASAGYGFLHDVLELAGGTDVLNDLHKQSVEMSTERILTRRPEVILELHYGNSLSPAAMDAERLVWNGLPSLPAVRNQRVYLLAGDEFVVPGPRIVLAAERFARTLHPEVFK